MSKNNTSAKARYEAFTEWHNWAKTKYSSLKTKKVKPSTPRYIEY